jgi:hypothetical protein
MARQKMNTPMWGARAAIIKPGGRSAAAAAAVALLPILAALVPPWVALSPAWASGAPARADGPLVVDAKSHVVVMEYEAWWGPKALTFQGTAAKPLLQSKDMKPLGGGYDSADPTVIRQHVEWLEYVGVDAAIAEVTNNVSCIFNSEWFVKKYLGDRCPPLQRSQNQKIRDNTGNLYPAWAKLRTPLKLMPLLGGIDQDVLFKDLDGKTALEKEVDYFGALMARHPELNVIYEGKPLMMIFLGAAQDPNPADKPLWFQIREFLKNHPAIGEKYTFRLMAGYLDSQPGCGRSLARPTGQWQSMPDTDSGAGSIVSSPTARSRRSARTTPLTTRSASGSRISPRRLPRRDKMAGAAPIPTLRPIVPTPRCATASPRHMRPSTRSWPTPARSTRSSS